MTDRIRDVGAAGIARPPSRARIEADCALSGGAAEWRSGGMIATGRRGRACARILETAAKVAGAGECGKPAAFNWIGIEASLQAIK